MKMNTLLMPASTVDRPSDKLQPLKVRKSTVQYSNDASHGLVSAAVTQCANGCGEAAECTQAAKQLCQQKVRSQQDDQAKCFDMHKLLVVCTQV